MAEIMCKNINDGCEMVSFIGLYNDTTELIEKLLKDYKAFISFMFIEPGYNKEYLVTLDKDMHIYCEEAYDTECNQYLYIGGDCIFVADDCNSAILKYIESKNIYEVSYDLNEDKNDTEMSSISETTHISRTKDGKVTGFTKSLSNTDPNGATHYSSYSYYGSNEDIVKMLAKEFGINI